LDISKGKCDALCLGKEREQVQLTSLLSSKSKKRRIYSVLMDPYEGGEKVRSEKKMEDI
jgi:hypothetical protein